MCLIFPHFILEKYGSWMIIMHSISFTKIWHDDDEKNIKDKWWLFFLVKLLQLQEETDYQLRTFKCSSVGFTQKDVDICAMQLRSMAFRNLFISLGYF